MEQTDQTDQTDKKSRYLGTFDIDNIKRDFGSHPVVYTRLMLSTINKEDLLNLKNKTSYLRAFGKQDTPTSKAYINCFIEDTDQIISSVKEEIGWLFDPSEQTELTELTELVDYGNDMILIEISYVIKNYFFLFNPLTEFFCPI